MPGSRIGRGVLASVAAHTVMAPTTAQLEPDIVIDLTEILDETLAGTFAAS